MTDKSCPNCGACIDSEHKHVGGQALHGINCQITYNITAYDSEAVFERLKRHQGEA